MPGICRFKRAEFKNCLLKLLFDQNISYKAVKKVETIFPGSAQVKRLGLENYSDKGIWSFARDKGFSIVTFDSDFFDLNTLYGTPPKIIWIRVGNLPTIDLCNLLIRQSELIHEYINNQSITGCLQII
jgi:predicted nuclease of predicted toxin-antitoxin system